LRALTSSLLGIGIDAVAMTSRVALEIFKKKGSRGPAHPSSGARPYAPYVMPDMAIEPTMLMMIV
jgi:hypothetical protein